MRTIVKNERLRGKIEVYDGMAARGGVRPVSGTSMVAVSQVPSVVPAAAPVDGQVGLSVPVQSAPVVTPVETWSVVVRGKKGISSREVMKKVLEKVGSTLKVRDDEVKETSDGGAVIHTPSIAEQQRIAENTKFADVGLEVVVQRVHAEISTDEFMQELYEMNFVGELSPESFKKIVRLTSSPWKAGGADSKLNVILECTDSVADMLSAKGASLYGRGLCLSVEWTG